MVHVEGYLTINRNGRVKYTKNAPNLSWDDIVPKPQPTELILNTKEMIEQSTGAKIDFSINRYEKEEKEDE